MDGRRSPLRSAPSRSPAITLSTIWRYLGVWRTGPTRSRSPRPGPAIRARRAAVWRARSDARGRTAEVAPRTGLAMRLLVRPLLAAPPVQAVLELAEVAAVRDAADLRTDADEPAHALDGSHQGRVGEAHPAVAGGE